MNKPKMKRIFLLAQSVLCVVLAVLLAAAVIGLCREGLALKAADPLHRIFTREKLAAALAPVLPLLLVSLVMSAAGLVLGIRDEKGGGRVRDAAPLRGPMLRRSAAPAGKLRLLRIALLVLALVLIVAGVLNGGARDVLGKAARICTECIGLG